MGTKRIANPIKVPVFFVFRIYRHSVKPRRSGRGCKLGLLTLIYFPFNIFIP